MSDTLTKLTYQTFQQGKSYFGLTHKILSIRLKELLFPKKEATSQGIPREAILTLQQRQNNLQEVDWEDAERGVYPKSLLFDNPWEDFFRYYPLIWVDLPQIWDRANQRKYQDFAADVDIKGYPSYYIQNFHHQTNGYLSDLSANLYDLQVEILFQGSADAMRRRILAPLKKGLEVFRDLAPVKPVFWT